MLILFKKYASVELVTVEAGKKKKVDGVDNGKVLNEMGVDVTLLDSSWFREIIRNEGFKVRGHFRLQPENSSMLPIITKSVDIAGKVVTVYRKY